MADSQETPTASSVASTLPSSAAEQARLRKERREAKIRNGGSARLNKITGLGGGIERDPPQQSITGHADPDEVDISSLNNQKGSISDAQLRQIMLGQDGSSPEPNPFAGFSATPDGTDTEDPMIQMLQQMMSGAKEAGGNANSTPNMDGDAAASAPDTSAYVWRVIHTVFALGLALYVSVTTSFSGTKIERDRSLASHVVGDGIEADNLSPDIIHFFWIFATAEVVLQTSRLLLEKGQIQSPGMLGMVTKFLPEPYKGYLGTLLRYMRIWTQISGDAMICVFVLGACAWFRST